MASGAVIELRSGSTARRMLSDLVMAWAHDAETGEPRYILELGADRRGAKCKCICVGCGEPLTAVNVSKDRFTLRPHFRHPEGVERTECLVLAARAAALRQLRETGWLELPRRRISGQVEGLSGTYYEAWVERPPEKLRITEVQYADRASALFTFEDGRTLHVDLLGTVVNQAVSDDSAHARASILISVEDPRIATMDPEEVRKHLTLLPDAMCWRSHWSDAQLLAEARVSAGAQAGDFLDQPPADLELPADMEPALKRQTILHHEAIRLLVQAGRIAVPELLVRVEPPNSDGSSAEQWMVPADVLQLDHMETEQPYGDIVPDLACKANSLGGGRVFLPMFIEVTVTNAIDDFRLERIRDKQCMALEVDLSHAGGRVTREELRRLVVDELATKRWLYHPEAEEQRETMLQHLQARAARRAAVLTTPLMDIAREYLEALTAHLLEGKSSEALCLGTPTHARLAIAIENFVIHGFPEAGSAPLINAHGILDRILSIQLDKGLGYKKADGHAVLNAVRQDRGEDKAYHSMYIIAAREFKPAMNDEQRKKFDTWRASIRASIEAGELTYLRPTVFDRILSLLFPSMAAAIAMKGAKRDPSNPRHSRARSTEWHETYDRNPALVASIQPSAVRARAPLLDTRPDEDWLRGRDLDRWKQQNPHWAKYFSGREHPSFSEEVTATRTPAGADDRHAPAVPRVIA